MASLDWQVRRRIELASSRGGLLEDPAHAALAAERGRRGIVRMSWGLLTAPLAAYLLWSWLDTDNVSSLALGSLCVLVLAGVVARLVILQRVRSQHLMSADFDGLREIALKHRMTYRRRD
jgi:hypothetical protein